MSKPSKHKKRKVKGRLDQRSYITRIVLSESIGRKIGRMCWGINKRVIWEMAVLVLEEAMGEYQL